eukprot:GEMP01010552.1.p1 GENE.GEMP01010552.1~~GEMP01010552.1.p1  ORF type:complete len:656 (+),score=139.37 GEMP01010552.1:375-2342(+)
MLTLDNITIRTESIPSTITDTGACAAHASIFCLTSSDDCGGDATFALSGNGSRDNETLFGDATHRPVDRTDNIVECDEDAKLFNDITQHVPYESASPSSSSSTATSSTAHDPPQKRWKSRKISTARKNDLVDVSLDDLVFAFRANDGARVRCLGARGILSRAHSEGTRAQMMRARVWMHAVGYIPTDITKWTYSTQIARQEYTIRLQAYRDVYGGNLTHANESVFGDIRKDVFRTRPETSFFSEKLRRTEKMLGEEDKSGNPALNIEDPVVHYDVVARILFMTALHRPDLGYVQGMNEVCAVLYYTFAQAPIANCEDIEADTYHCFNQLLDRNLTNFFKMSMDPAQGFLAASLRHFEEILADKDPEVYARLAELQIRPEHYAVSWLMLFFAQEVTLPDCQRLWDALLNEPDGNYAQIYYVCAAVVHSLREELLAADYTEAMNLLHRSPFANGVGTVLAIADAMRQRNFKQRRSRTPSTSVFQNLASHVWRRKNSRRINKSSHAVAASPARAEKGNEAKVTEKSLSPAQIFHSLITGSDLSGTPSMTSTLMALAEEGDEVLHEMTRGSPYNGTDESYSLVIPPMGICISSASSSPKENWTSSSTLNKGCKRSTTCDEKVSKARSFSPLVFRKSVKGMRKSVASVHTSASRFIGQLS